jgi:hypothetical protein
MFFGKTLPAHPEPSQSWSNGDLPPSYDPFIIFILFTPSEDPFTLHFTRGVVQPRIFGVAVQEGIMERPRIGVFSWSMSSEVEKIFVLILKGNPSASNIWA